MAKINLLINQGSLLGNNDILEAESGITSSPIFVMKEIMG